jgi:betaine reductase
VPDLGKLAGKKVLLLGERDGVAAPAMEESLKGCGADIVFSVTECFV